MVGIANFCPNIIRRLFFVRVRDTIFDNYAQKGHFLVGNYKNYHTCHTVPALTTIVVLKGYWKQLL